MNHRERFMGVLQFRTVDRVPDYEFGYWTETVSRWNKEGLPQGNPKAYFGFDSHASTFFPLKRLPIRNGFWPGTPSRMLEKNQERVTIDDGMGGIFIRSTEGMSPPHYIRYPLKSRRDWERFEPFFSPDTPGRFPLNWEEFAEGYKERDYPLGISVGGLYGLLRNWMGVENISIAFYREPEWIEDMMDKLTNLWITMIKRALGLVKVDFATWWEDMCYCKGSLLSVHHFEEFMVPRYKKVTRILKEYGVEINILDSDGDVTRLVPGWLDAGINCILPFEARYNDVYQLREEFGNELLLMGGVDKFALMKGRKAIDEELERLTPLFKQGGYIPMVDHHVPPEVSLSNYRYYIKKKREWIGKAD